MTLVDLMALVAGVGTSFALVASLPGSNVIRSPLDQLVYSVIRLFQGMSLALSAVALARVAAYRRMPTPAEWLGILVGTSLLTDLPEFRVDSWIYAYRWAFPSLDPLSYTGVRWVGAGLFSAGILIGLGFLRLGRQLLPTWLRTIVLAWMALLGMAGPLWVFGQHGADWFSPPGGFGPGTASTLYRGACGLAAHLPMGLLFGVPALASLNQRISCRKWIWTEWANLSCSTMTGFAFMMLYRGEFRFPSPAWLAERLLVLAWFLAVALLSRLILMRFLEDWGRRIGWPADQDLSPPPGPGSASRTR